MRPTTPPLDRSAWMTATPRRRHTLGYLEAVALLMAAARRAAATLTRWPAVVERAQARRRARQMGGGS